jgi:hypothetical protein
LLNNNPTIENRKITIEHIISVGWNRARHVISGIIQRLISIPGIIPHTMEAIAVTKYITLLTTLFFNINKRMLKMIIAKEIMATVRFAL